MGCIDESSGAAGAAYYAQWKLTRDAIAEDALPGAGVILNPEIDNQHRVFGLGPDVTLPVATKERLFALVNVATCGRWE